jgi:hypothetical protein
MALRTSRAAALLLLAAACGGMADAPASTGAAPAVVAAGGGGPAKPLCPRTGHWTECIVFARLEQAGVAPRREGTIADLPALGPTPAVYSIGKNAIAVYLFADAGARERAARSLDTLHFIAPSAGLTMRNEATAIQNDNLLALLYSQIDQQRERVSDAFLAGAPQP